MTVYRSSVTAKGDTFDSIAIGDSFTWGACVHWHIKIGPFKSWVYDLNKCYGWNSAGQPGGCDEELENLGVADSVTFSIGKDSK